MNAITRAALGMLALLIGLWLAPAAAAHTDLTSSNPKNGATLKTPPSQVSLTFTEEVKDPAYVVVSVGASKLKTSDPVIDGRTVSVDLGEAETGAYRVAYRVISVDGHPVSGVIKFNVAGSEASPTPEESVTATPKAAPSSGADSHTHDEGNWFQRHPTHIALGATLLACALGLLVWSRRQTS